MKTTTSKAGILAVGLFAGGSPFADGDEVRTFDAENAFEIHVPEGAQEVRGWFALPADDDELQEISDLAIDVDAPDGATVQTRETRDVAGNRFLHLFARDVAGADIGVTTTFRVARREAVHSTDPDATRPPTSAELLEMAPYLAESTNIRIDDEVRRIAQETTAGEENPLRKARLLYDRVLDDVTYWVKHPDRMKSSGVGSSEYCLAQGCGNCTDFHSLYAALARAAEIPTRMVYGSFFKGPLAGKEKDQSYHCWIEFWVPELEWIPLDVAVADIFVDDFSIDEANADLVSLTVADGYQGPDAGLVDYYFGNLDARRVTWNRGRDLVLEPKPEGGPVNALPKAYIEVDGRPLAEREGWTRLLTFEEQ